MVRDDAAVALPGYFDLSHEASSVFIAFLDAWGQDCGEAVNDGYAAVMVSVPITDEAHPIWIEAEATTGGFQVNAWVVLSLTPAVS